MRLLGRAIRRRLADEQCVIPSVGIPGLRPTAGGKKREATAEAQRTQSDAEPFSCLCASLRSLRLCGCFWIFRAARDLGGVGAGDMTFESPAHPGPSLP